MSTAPLELFVKKREVLPGYWFLSCRDMTSGRFHLKVWGRGGTDGFLKGGAAEFQISLYH